MNLLIALIFSFGPILGSEFSLLMGKNKPEWTYVSKQEDVAALERFEELFEKNKDVRSFHETKEKIPYVIHFVWLESDAPSKENIASWVNAHPGWEFKLWSDRHVDVGGFPIQLMDVSTFPFFFSKEVFDLSESSKEKADLLRFEVLYQEGGLLVDLQFQCQKPFTELHKAYDFFCGLRPPHPPIAGRNLSMVREVIGARPFHPVVGKLVRDPSISMIHALLHRLEEDGNRDIVFPAHYFCAQQGYATLKEMALPLHIARTLDAKKELPDWLGKGALSLNVLALTGAGIYFALRKRRREQ